MLDKLVAAVIVTYNRKCLLTKCLNSVLQQTNLVNKIFIIDNASTDGTLSFLQEQGYLNNPIIHYIRLSTNTGGAGGFYEGMKRAYFENYDWLWLMDDDGYAESDCLEKLLEAKDSLDIIGSTVVLPENPSKLTWSYIYFEKNGYFSFKKRIRNHDELISLSVENIYKHYAAFFNAILINRKVIQDIGFVFKELFIRGDEFEYFLRARAAGIRLGTKTDAFYYHPFQSFKVSKIKYFYAFRNIFYNYIKYRNFTYPFLVRSFYLIYIFLKYIFMIPSFSPSYFFEVIQAVYFATKGKLLPYNCSG